MGKTSQPVIILPGSRERLVSTANLLAGLFALLAITLMIINIFTFGFHVFQLLFVATALAELTVIFLNQKGLTVAGRLLFCIAPTVFTLVITLLDKVLLPQQEYITYFDSRFFLLITTVFPAIVFDWPEWRFITISLFFTFVSIVFFDPLHNILGLGYYQQGYTVPSYYHVNHIMFLSFVALLLAVFILKWRDYQVTRKLIESIAEQERAAIEVLDRNRKLEQLTREMEAQNEEMIQQQEELKASHEMLEHANQLIGEQQLKLKAYNTELERLVREKSEELVLTNEELIKSNNELRQFSFTVSHNLRGPVARLLGLTNLMKIATSENEIRELSDYISRSAADLDSILRDLSMIIDIRNDLYRVREKISLLEEVERTLLLVGFKAGDGLLEVNFEKAPYVYAIRPMVHSIFYNLISNAVKYKSPDRILKISIRSFNDGKDKIIVEVADNGLGIDLKSQGQHVFKLYKRFHHHVPGKGLGLYLVKSQMEIMGGKVEVSSEPDKGTLFRLIFPVPADVSKQYFFENDAAQLYYDATINNTVIIWKRNVTSAEYRKVFEVVFETIKTYHTPGWIADLRNQGVIQAEDQKWFINTVLRAAYQHGLRRIAAVGFQDPMRRDYYERMKEITQELGIELRVFDSVEAAVAWMARFSG
ncbi:MAG: ATP-binding protein [Cyclobacteriaceae bacterium]|nr:ATP-binding protein [Cyclobacteriaceae bacterium]